MKGAQALIFDLICTSCNSKYESKSQVYTCKNCGKRLRIEYKYSRQHNYLAEIIKTAEGGVWNYREFLPVESDKIITMGEGNTPLVEAPNLESLLEINNVFIKNETLNPTGTFKDRCMTVAISKAVEFNATAVILGSAGNAASAAAAYATRANMPCYVLIPAVTPIERVVQTALYGGRIIRIDGTVNDCIDMIHFVQKEYGWHNVTTANVYNPYQGEGPKTIAYEIARQLNWKTPDWILVPIGGGGILSAIWRGFKEMYEIKVIDKLPRMVGLQADGCASVVKAFKEKKKSHEIEDWGKPNTIAAAIADPYPLDGQIALESIYESHGYAEWVSDEEIMNGQKILARCEGIFAEPASSTTIAGLIKLKSKGIINRSDSVVCVVTGTGLKDPAIAAKNIIEPPIIANDINSLLNALSGYEKHDVS